MTIGPMWSQPRNLWDCRGPRRGQGTQRRHTHTGVSMRTAGNGTPSRRCRPRTREQSPFDTIITSTIRGGLLPPRFLRKCTPSEARIGNTALDRYRRLLWALTPTLGLQLTASHPLRSSMPAATQTAPLSPCGGMRPMIPRAMPPVAGRSALLLQCPHKTPDAATKGTHGSLRGTPGVLGLPVSIAPPPALGCAARRRTTAADRSDAAPGGASGEEGTGVRLEEEGCPIVQVATGALSKPWHRKAYPAQARLRPRRRTAR